MDPQDPPIARVDDRPSRASSRTCRRWKIEKVPPVKSSSSKLAFFRFGAEITDFLSISQSTFDPHCADRHYQSARRNRCDADVEIAVINDIVAVDRALMIGYFFSAATAALTKNDIETELTPCLFIRLSLYFVAERSPLHVHFVERRQDRISRLRLQ